MKEKIRGVFIMNATCLIIYVSMSGLDLNGKIAVSFGSSDSSYEHWGEQSIL